MKKAIIGISASMIFDSSDSRFLGYARSYVNDDYIQSVTRSGAVPITLPIVDSDEEVKAQVDLIDALILMGGQDVDPYLYGEETDKKHGMIYPRRDRFDYKLIKYAFEKGIPILGICRGHQILNVYFGGSLYQDLSYFSPDVLQHVQQACSYEATQTIQIEKNSILQRIIGDTKRVNSFHHLAVKDLADNFVVTARTKDGVVEAIEYQGDERYILGVQFHPEMMSSRDEDMQAIFNDLNEQALKFKGGNNV